MIPERATLLRQPLLGFGLVPVADLLGLIRESLLLLSGLTELIHELLKLRRQFRVLMFAKLVVRALEALEHLLHLLRHFLQLGESLIRFPLTHQPLDIIELRLHVLLRHHVAKGLGIEVLVANALGKLGHPVHCLIDSLPERLHPAQDTFL